MSLRFPKCFPAPCRLLPASRSLDSILEDVHFAEDSDPRSGPHCPSGVPSPASWNLEGGSRAALPNLNSTLQGCAALQGRQGFTWSRVLLGPATQRGLPRMSGVLRTSSQSSGSPSSAWSVSGRAPWVLWVLALRRRVPGMGPPTLASWPRGWDHSLVQAHYGVPRGAPPQPPSALLGGLRRHHRSQDKAGVPVGAPGDCVLVSWAPLFTGWPSSMRKSPSFGSPSFQPLLFFVWFWF